MERRIEEVIKSEVKEIDLRIPGLSEEDFIFFIENSPQIESVSLYSLSFRWVPFLRKLKNLTTLSLDAWSFSQEDLNTLFSLKQISNLKINGTILSKEFFEKLAEQTQLISLSLIDCENIYDQDFELVSHLKNLESLHLYFPNITDKGLEALSKLKKLSVIKFETCEVTEKGLKQLSNLNLRELLLNKCEIGKMGISTLPQYKNLGKLTLLDIPITDVLLKQIASLENLKELSLGSVAKYSDKGLGYLSSLTKLTHLYLELNHRAITNQGMNLLEKLSKLQSLSLYGLSPDLTSEGFQFLQNLHLKKLELRFVLKNEMVKNLDGLKDLEELNLSYCDLNNESLSCLANFSKLTKLNLSHLENITDECLTYLIHLPLTELDLSFCPHITDAGLKYLSPLLHLHVLNLNKCEKITDTGLKNLSLLPHLKFLNVKFCQVTEESVNDLIQKNPLLNIYYLKKRKK